MGDPALPFELRLTLRAGTVYYFVHRGLFSAEPHYFVVANPTPLTDSVLLLAVASSQVEKIRARRRGMPNATLVTVEPAAYAPFTKPTLIDCNMVFELPRSELVAKFGARELKFHPDLPSDIVRLVQAGILASPRVDMAHKKIIDPNYTPPP
ncbi:MAG: hypothetical protein HUU04_08145 [Verrucomicrobiae bacterium]|nr:hypothetical protein [Verrucomicrobiae bacterium]